MKKQLTLDFAMLDSDDAYATAAGERIARLLSLRINRETGRVDTYIGDKTYAGLARTVARFIAEPESSVALM